MRRLLDFLIQTLPMWFVILVFYVLGGLAAGLGAYTVNRFMGSAASLILFIIVGGAAGLLLGIWTISQR